MPWWHKLTGVVVINDIPDEDDGLELPVKEDEKKEKKPKEPPKKPPEPPPTEDDELYGVMSNEVTCKQKLLFDKWYRLLYILLLCAFLGLILPIILDETAFKPAPYEGDQRGYCLINDSIKYPCLDFNVSKEDCIAALCCYHTTDDPFAPECYHGEPSQYGYSVVDHAGNLDKVAVTGVELQNFQARTSLYRLGDSDRMNFTLSNITKTNPYGDLMWPAALIVERGGNDLIRLTFYSPGQEEGTLMKDPTFIPDSADRPKIDVQVTQVQGYPFNITVYRYGHKDRPLFRTLLGPIMFGDGYTELTTTIASKSVFGFGTRPSASANPVFDEFEQWTLNSRDSTYSETSFSDTQPFYMSYEPDTGNYYGIYIKTSTPLQIRSVPSPGMSFRAPLGTFKVLVMAGPTPQDVMRQYTKMVGRTPLPPYWAFGFHMCRTVSDPQDTEDPNLEKAKAAYESVRDGMSDAKIPYESDCIDARLSYPDTYGELPDWSTQEVADLHKSNRKFNFASYPYLVAGSAAYIEAQDVDVLLELPNGTYYGQIAGRAVGYPDYLDSNSYDIWLNGSEVAKNRTLAVDSYILLQNSPLNEAIINYDQEVNETCSLDCPECCCARSPFNFTVDSEVEDVSDGTICWQVVQRSLDNSKHLAHHNAYGLYHSKRMHDALKNFKPKSRPFLLSASTHPGSGSYGGQLAEGYGTGVEEQQRSLHTLLFSGLAGVSMAGPPVCGTRNDTIQNGTDATLDDVASYCLRSYQMSLFFPLFISHYEMNQAPRNPPDIGSGFASSIKPFLLLRYSLIPYLYTLAEESSRTGAPIVRPLFYEFPDDPDSLEMLDQFMVGSSLLVVPNFEPASASESVHGIQVPAYLPAGCWYNLFSGEQVSCENNGTYTSFDTVVTDINVFMREGSILFLQGDLHSDISNTEESRALNYTVVATAYNTTTSTSIASGYIYYDDGVSPLTADNPDYSASEIVSNLDVKSQTLEIKRTPAGDVPYRYCDPDENYSSTVNDVFIYGLDQEVSKVKDDNGDTFSFEFDSTTFGLHITQLGFSWCKGSVSTTLTWTYV